MKLNSKLTLKCLNLFPAFSLLEPEIQKCGEPIKIPQKSSQISHLLDEIHGITLNVGSIFEPGVSQ